MKRNYQPIKASLIIILKESLDVFEKRINTEGINGIGKVRRKPTIFFLGLNMLNMIKFAYSHDSSV